MTTTAATTPAHAPRTTPGGAPGDLLGAPLDDAERALLEIYDRIVAALRRDDLPPCVAANLRAALAPVAVAVTDLGLRFEHLTDLDV
ncbi:hypothetical protein [Pseudonocardia spirodelae]|uniref:Uncharacterized protein n=1 Tax=Pseudonocardia spirodelae TaxID=3133431 RepID=A0ABU8T7P9_9PSEU